MPERFQGRLEIEDVCIDILTNYQPWHKYLAAHFGEHFSVGPDKSSGDISIKADWQAQSFRRPSLKAQESDRFPERIGGSIVSSSDEICWVQKLRGSQRLSLIAGWKDGSHLRLEAEYRRKTMKEVFKGLTGQSLAQRLFELTYPLVYYPLWFYLEKLFGWHVMHASAVRMPYGKALVIAGLEGIGKTTLSLGCAIACQGELIADNLIWYDYENVRGVPEPIRLHDIKSELIKKVSLRPLDMGKTQKGFFGLTHANRKPTPACAVVLPVFGRTTEICEINPEDCADRVLSSNQLAGELSAYVPFSAWMNLLSPVPGIDTLRRQRLVSLLRKCHCAILRMQRGRVKEATDLALEWASH